MKQESQICQEGGVKGSGHSRQQSITSQGANDEGLQSAFEQSRAMEPSSFFEADDPSSAAIFTDYNDKKVNDVVFPRVQAQTGAATTSQDEDREISEKLAQDLRVSLPYGERASGQRGGNQENLLLSGGDMRVSTGIFGSQDRRSTIRSMDSQEEINDRTVMNDTYQALRNRIAEDFLKPLPIIPKGSAYQEGLDVPKWRQKKNLLLSNGTKQSPQKQTTSENIQPQVNQETAEEEEVNPGDPDQKVKTVEQVQEKLNKHAEQIPLLNQIQIDKDLYPRYFKYPIYECYKPDNLLETRKMLQIFLLQSKTAILGGDVPTIDSSYYSEYLKYLRKEFSTKFPNYINEKHLLSFDSNYESGNLDSAYVVNENEYNLLMKVDSNTKGSSFWFNFKVRGIWKSTLKQRTNLKESTERGRVIKFNIVNFSKNDVKGFYQSGMNVHTRVCREEDDAQNRYNRQSWETNKCFDIEFFQNIDVERGQQGYNRYFFQLSFKYRFEPEKGEDGPTVQFAYCMPYTFTDLLVDLKHIKFQLLDGGLTKEATITYFNGKNNQLKPEELQLALGVEGQTEQTEENNDQSKQQQHQNTGQPSFLERQRLTIYEQQHMEIRNRGLKVIRLNQIEKALMATPDNAEESPQYNIEGLIHENLRASDGAKINSIVNSEGGVTGEELEIRTQSFMFRQEIMGRTVGGLPIYLLTISNNSGPYIPMTNKYGQQKKKKLIYITARVHAGETHASLVMGHLMHEICLTPKSKYEALLQNYIIKLVPMINVDGVVIGNSRTSLVGLDLNRRWTEPNPLIHPEVFFLKKEMLQAHKKSEGGIQIFCDLHGHNKSPNSFVYGCHKAANQGLLSWTKTRLLPKIIATLTPLFDFKQCQFKIDRCKLNTARVVCWNELKITNSFTLEVSMYGKLITKAQARAVQKIAETCQGNPQGEGFSIPLSPREKEGEQKTIVGFDPIDFDQIAKSLLQSLLHYNSIEPQLEQEFQQTGGWLKVSRLNHMTGKAARDRLEEQSLAKKQEKKISQKKPQVNRQGKKIQQQQSFKNKVEEEVKDEEGSLPKMGAGSYNNIVVTEKDSSNQLSRKLTEKVSSAISSTIRQQQHLKQKSKSQGLQEPVLSKQNNHQNNHIRLSGSFNWRDFFDQGELDRVTKSPGKTFKKLSKNEILEDENEDADGSDEKSDKEGGSDSDPSEDNIDPQDFLAMVQNAFKDDEEVTFKELKPQPKQERSSIRVDDDQIKQSSSPQESNKLPLLTEEDEGYNFILRPIQPMPTLSPPQILPPPPPMIVMSSNVQHSHHAPLEIQSENYKKLMQGQRKMMQYAETGDPGLPIGKSPVTLKQNSNTQYTAWSQSKNRNQEKSGGRQIPKISKLRSSHHQQQSIRVQQTIEGAVVKHQLLQDIVQGGVSRLQEIEKNIFSTQQSQGFSKPTGTHQIGQTNLNPYLIKKAQIEAGIKAQSAPGSNQIQGLPKNNYFTAGDPEQTSFESYMQIVRPSQAINMSFSNSESKANRKIMSGATNLREEINQAQTIPTSAVFIQNNHNHRMMIPQHQHIVTVQAAALLRQSVNSVNNQENADYILRTGTAQSPSPRSNVRSRHPAALLQGGISVQPKKGEQIIKPPKTHRSNDAYTVESETQRLYRSQKRQEEQYGSNNLEELEVNYLQNNSPDKLHLVQSKPSASVSPAVLMTKRLEQWKQQTAQMSGFMRDTQYQMQVPGQYQKQQQIIIASQNNQQRQRILLHQQQQQLNNSRGGEQLPSISQNTIEHRAESSQIGNKRSGEAYQSEGVQRVRESQGHQYHSQKNQQNQDQPGYMMSFKHAVAPISLTQVSQSQHVHPLLSNSALSTNQPQINPSGGQLISREKNQSQPSINQHQPSAASLTDLLSRKKHPNQPQSSRPHKELSPQKKNAPQVYSRGSNDAGTIIVQVGAQHLTEFQEKMRQQYQKHHSYINTGYVQMKNQSTKQSISYPSVHDIRDQSPAPVLQGGGRGSVVKMMPSPAIGSPRASGNHKISEQHTQFMQNLVPKKATPPKRQQEQNHARGATPNLSVVLNGPALNHFIGGSNNRL